MKTIEHIFPEIGQRSIRVFGQAEFLHDWLEQNGIIDRLAKTPQLGMANVHFPEFRHTRLDYMYLILHIVDILQEHTTEFRLDLSSNKTFIVGGTTYKLSAAEVMQEWAMLLNIGHMHDTFFAESLLHRHFRRHWDVISQHFRNPWSRSWGKQMLRDSDYRFHYLLALLELERLPRNSRDYKPLAFLLGLYRTDELSYLKCHLPAGTGRIRNTYKIIRRVAYLALDTSYSRCPFEISMSKLMSILPWFIRRLVDDDQALNRQLDTFSEWMGDRYYCSPSCVLTMVDNIERLDRRYARGLKRNLYDQSRFLGLVKDWKRDTISVQPAKNWIHVIRIPVRPPADANTDEFIPMLIREENYTLSVINVGNGSSYYLDIFARQASNPYRAIALIPRSALLSILQRLKSNTLFQYGEDKDDHATYRERRLLVRQQCADHLYSYAEAIFKLLAGTIAKNVTFSLARSEGIGWLCCASTDDLRRDFTSYIEYDFIRHAETVSEDETMVRKTELEFSKHVVQRHLRTWHDVAFFTGQVDIHHRVTGPLTDIDGLAILFRNTDIRLLLLQNKTSHSGGVSQAKRWFRTKLRPLLPNIRGSGRYKIHEYSEGIAVSIDFTAT